MRYYEKEVIGAGIRNEEWVIKELKSLYKKANDDINEKIKALKARFDEEGLQSIIYQMDYQKDLRTQINGFLDVLYADEHTKLSSYLNLCYEDGFIGTMYSLQKQGIPLILPMDQEQIINAIVHESKISEGLYKKLGVDVKDLKKRINAEVSRGIANNYSTSDIARNINNASQIGINKAIRIARTEGHRIQAQSQLDAAYKAKEKGANVVKQWDSSLDRKVRATHAQLDGQIRKLDEPFEAYGHKAQAPSQFGIASEDINCRCVILQRAKWALDDEELEELKERAKYYKLDKTKDFEDYKKKYLKAVDENASIDNKVHEAIESARKVEPNITNDISSIVEKHGGRMEGLQYRLKTEGSLNRKVRSEILEKNINVDEAISGMFDQVRYTSVSESNNLTRHYAKTISELEEKGYKMVRCKNTLQYDNVSYRGINCVLEDPNGYKFELQFHTPQSLKIKEINHKLYEEARLDTTTLIRKNELEEIMLENAKQITTPSRVDKIISFNTLENATEELTKKKLHDSNIRSFVFVKANTTMEAWNYSRRFANRVDLYSVDNLDSLNDLNETLDELYEKYPIKQLQTLKTNSRLKTSAARACYNELEINPENLSEGMKKLYISPEEWESSRLRILKNYRSYLESPSFDQKQIKKVIKQLEEDLKYTRHNVTYKGLEIRSTIAHEYGHIIADQYLGQINLGGISRNKYLASEAIELREAIVDTFKKAKKTGDIYKISRYASTDQYEFFAESFAMYDLGRETLPDYIQNLIERVIEYGRK